jgi:hypothetical protein
LGVQFCISLPFVLLFYVSPPAITNRIQAGNKTLVVFAFFYFLKASLFQQIGFFKTV